MSMGTVLVAAGAAAGLFAMTNVDDLVVLAVLSASSRAGGGPERWQIWAGQYLGQAVVAATSSLLGVAGITIANGGDNLAAYTPVFATIGGTAAAVTVVVFAAGTAVWCLAGWWLVSHHRVTDTVLRWGHWIIPAVYVLIGLYIFQKAGAFGRAF